MSKGVNVQITAGGGGTPVTYSLERQLDGGGYSLVDGSIPYTASPQIYEDTNGGAGFPDASVIDYRATATNTDGTSSNSAVQQITISGLVPDPNNVWTNQYFIDTSGDGKADDVNIYGSTTATIETGNGQIGNAQKILKTSTGSTDYMGIASLGGLIGDTYDITFMYRGDGGVGGSCKFACAGNYNMASNTGTAILKTFNITTTSVNQATQFWPTQLAANNGAWIEISDLLILKTS